MTGITLIPASLRAGRINLGVPAPVVTIGTFSSMITFTSSSTFFSISTTLTANGLSVSLRNSRISSRNWSPVIPPEAIIPKPPASETATAN
ncbi:MAG: hypothetical protein Q615_SPAC00113G0423 [Streptococcus anginosus DORA_7]|uniref:Uncharacterized protein n=1 Tax=Streptococcus anginosus DORA_7 TaxID=1403946 RepID=W1U2A4_STRAP|nr:MAG: hypothetical protein Q615_SPAC00113G0423 [Streptococcus anginosus DORA_7]